MLTEGATILDIGGYSSRPGAKDISNQEEIDRIAPVIEAVSGAFPDAIISIDTFRSEVANIALDAGAGIINDISGGRQDEAIFKIAAQHQAPYILMHMRGTPQNMQDKVEYTDLIKDIQAYFSNRISSARSAGVKDIIIDPGFGFSKTVEQNFALMKQLEMLHLHNAPLLVGISRKSMIYKKLESSAQEALNGTTALNMYALTKGACFLRVHDVKEAKETIRLHQAILGAE
jgi:dihydropteroate synthase